MSNVDRIEEIVDISEFLGITYAEVNGETEVCFSGTSTPVGVVMSEGVVVVNVAQQVSSSILSIGGIHLRVWMGLLFSSMYVAATLFN